MSATEVREAADRLETECEPESSPCQEPAHLDGDGHHLKANMEHEHLHGVNEPKLLPKQAKKSIFGALFSRTLPQCPFFTRIPFDSSPAAHLFV